MKQQIQDLIDDILAAQKNNLFLWVPFFFAVGIASYFSLRFEPVFSVSFFTLCGFLTISIFLYLKGDLTPVFKLMFLLSLAISLVASGFFLAQIRSLTVHTPMITKKISPVGVSGVIETIEVLSDKDGSRVILSELDIERLSTDATPRKIRLKIRQDEGLKKGQYIKVLAGLNPPGSPVIPGGFDFRRMAYFESIGAVGFSYTKPEIVEDIEGATSANSVLDRVRLSLIQNIEAHTQDTEKSIVIALMTGQRGLISDGNWDALRQSGLAHLLAISGLHVGMVAGVLFFFSRLLMACSPYLALHYPIKKWAAVIALAGAAFYTVMVGAPIPTQRALIMTGLMMLAIILDRSPFSMRLVAIAAIVVLFFTPESLTSVSFQMSFAAVVSLIYFYDVIRPYWRRLHSRAGVFRKVFLYFIGVSLTTIIAGAATGLFALYHFQNYANFGVIANLVAVPVMAFVIMPLIVLCYIVMPLGLSGVIFPFIEGGVSWVLATAHWVSSLDGALLHVQSFPPWIFFVTVICLWFWIVWQGRLKLITIPILFALWGLVTVYQQPDILISSKVDLIAVRGKDGESLCLSTKSKERYTADQWMRASGLAGQEKIKWPQEGGAVGFPLKCDAIGCRGEIKGHKVAVAFTQDAWREDCNWADVLVSQTPVPYQECAANYVIDFFDVWRSGPHAIWLSPHRVKIRSVEGARGSRPWAKARENKT